MPHPTRLLAALTLALLAGAASAQDVRVYRAGESVDPDEVARILAPARPAAPKMRSLRVLDDVPSPSGGTAVAMAAQDSAPPAAAEPPAATAALSLPVQFAFDSADILPAARPQLDALAEGIRRLPADRRVTIEGHTDAVGSQGYNDALSLRRARAVKQYLVALHRIDPQRLQAVGLGKDAPLPGTDPAAGVNRRVQFHGE